MRNDLTPESALESLPQAGGDCSGFSAWRQELRRQAIARRMALSNEECAQHSKAICRHLGHHFPQLAEMRVGFCWPMKNEPDLRPLFEAWRRRNSGRFAALLPVVVAADTALAFRVWAPETPMVDDRYGIPTPASGDFLQPEALLIPLVAFDASGYRLGYGGGFFDRTLSALRPRPLCVGVGFELSRVDTIYPEPHDERLDAVVTEVGMFACA